MSKATPMMRQYREAKAAHPEAILFFGWETSMKCSVMMLFWLPENWISL